MKALVCGGRHFAKGLGPASAQQTLTSIFSERGRPSVVMQGDAAGYDLASKLWAEAHGIETRTFRADWQTHGRAAGPIRNQQMIDAKPDLVVAFPGGRGTEDCKRRARSAGIEVLEVE